jgi:hypothetical protein
MSDISVNDVVSAIHGMMKRPRGPLAVETVDIMLERPISARLGSERPLQRL